MPGSLFDKGVKENRKTQLVSKDVRILWMPHLPRPDNHARRMHQAFHVRTLKAVKKVVNRDERRLRAENEEKINAVYHADWVFMSKDHVHRSISVLKSRDWTANRKS